MIDDQERGYVTRYFSFHDSLPIGMCVIKDDFTVLCWNNRLSMITGIESKTIIGSDLNRFLPCFDHSDYKKNLAPVFEGSGPITLPNDSFHCILPNTGHKKTLPGNTIASPVPAYTGNGYYAVISVEDESKAETMPLPNRLPYETIRNETIEDELQHNNRLLQGVLLSTPIATVLVENRIVKWGNEAARALFGYSREEDYIGKETRVFYASNAWYNAINEIVFQLTPAERLIETDAEFRRKNGEIFTGHLMITCIDPERPHDRSIATISDLTSRIQAEQIRIQKEKLLSILQLAGAVCHELNQPLMAITGYADLLLLDLDREHPHYGKLKKINDQIKKTGDITRKLMGITKYDAHLLTAENHPFSLNNLKVPSF